MKEDFSYTAGWRGRLAGSEAVKCTPLCVCATGPGGWQLGSCWSWAPLTVQVCSDHSRCPAQSLTAVSFYVLVSCDCFSSWSAAIGLSEWLFVNIRICSRISLTVPSIRCVLIGNKDTVVITVSWCPFFVPYSCIIISPHLRVLGPSLSFTAGSPPLAQCWDSDPSGSGSTVFTSTKLTLWTISSAVSTILCTDRHEWGEVGEGLRGQVGFPELGRTDLDPEGSGQQRKATSSVKASPRGQPSGHLTRWRTSVQGIRCGIVQGIECQTKVLGWPKASYPRVPLWGPYRQCYGGADSPCK